MAQLKDSIVSGNLRVTDSTLTDVLQTDILKVRTSSSASTYGPGTNGQVLKSNGTNAYWDAITQANIFGASAIGGAKNFVYYNGSSLVATTQTLGTSTKPLYLSSGTFTECSSYAGGTAVTLNNASKAASTASFYAPTAGGTAGYLLIGKGTTTAPDWSNVGFIDATNSRFGIGTTSPAYKLDVNGTTHTTSLIIGTTTDAKNVSLVWDDTAKAWHLNGNFYADGFISAGGLSNSSGGGGVDIDAVWASLTNSVTDEYASTRIAQSHLPAISSSGSGVVSAIAYSGSGNNLVLSVTKTAVVTSLGTKTGAITLSGGLSIDSSNVLSSTDNKVTQTATTTSSAYELLFSATADNTTRTEGARKTSTLTYNPSTKALSTGGAVNGLTLSSQTTGFKISGGTTSKTLTVGADYTLAAACAKAVVTSVDTSASLPTSKAVKDFVEGKGYVTSSGVTSITLTSGTGITVSNSGTAITGEGSRTISLNVSGAKTALGLGTMAYEAKADYVLLATAQTISAKHTFSSGILLNTASSWTSSDRAIAFSADGEDANIRYYNTDSNKGLTFNPNTGELKAAKFTRRGGTSSQFLKADGSTDSNTYLTSHQALYNLVINNSAGTAQITYKPGTSGTYSLTLTKTMVGLGNVDNLAASDYFTALSSSTSTPLSITVGGTTKTLSSLYATTAERPRSISGTAETGGYNLNTVLAGGGAIRNVSSSSYWAHAPQGLGYFGAAIQINPANLELGAMQFAYNMNYNGTTPTDKIWWRARNNDGWADDWHLIYDSTTLTKSVITGLLGSTTYAPYHSDGYLPLSGGTMTGDIMMTDGEYINASNGYAMLGLDTSGNFYCGSGFNVSGTFLIRSGNINLTHRKFTSSSQKTDYVIWDASNSGISTKPWACSTLSVNTSLTLPNDVSILGTLTDSSTVSIAKVSTSNNIVIGGSSFAHNVNLYGTLVKFYAGGTTAIGTVSSTGLGVTGTVTASGIGTFDRVVLSNSGAVSHIEFTRAGWNYISVPTDGVIAFNTGGSGSANTSMAVTPDGIRAGTKGVHSCGLPTAYWGSIYGKDLYIGGDAYNTAAGSIIFSEKLEDLRNGFKIAPVHAASANRVNLVFYRSNNGTSPYAANWTTFMTLSYDGKATIAGSLTTSGDQTISSDATLKTNWKELNYTVKDIANVKIGIFDWKDGHGTSAGSVAQDWKKLIPELVHGDEGNMTLAYGQIAMLNTILLARRSEDHETRIKALEAENAKLKEEIKRLKN